MKCQLFKALKKKKVIAHYVTSGLEVREQILVSELGVVVTVSLF